MPRSVGSYCRYFCTSSKIAACLSVAGESFRQLLQCVDRERERLRKENSRLGEEVEECHSLIRDQNKENDRLGRRNQVAEKENRMIRQKLSLCQHEKQELENEVRGYACEIARGRREWEGKGR